MKWQMAMAEEDGQYRMPILSGGPLQRPHVRHSSRKLIECLRLSRVLKAGAYKLEFAMQRAVNVLHPNIPPVKLTTELPSTSALHRYELSLDVAIMRNRADEWQGRIRFMWMDASPQKKINWIWAEFYDIRLDVLLDVFVAVVEMSTFTRSLTDEPDELDDIFDREDWPGRVGIPVSKPYIGTLAFQPPWPVGTEVLCTKPLLLFTPQP